MGECALGGCGEVDILDAGVEKIFDISVPTVGDKEARARGDCNGRGDCLLASRAGEGDAGNAEEESGKGFGRSVMVGCSDPTAAV